MAQTNQHTGGDFDPRLFAVHRMLSALRVFGYDASRSFGGWLRVVTLKESRS